MTSGEAPPGRIYRGLRTGGRSERVRDAVLRATLFELARVGYSELTVAAVAKQAEVAVTTVHRRWLSKEELVADTLEALLRIELEIPDRGAVALELRMLASTALRALDNPAVMAMLRTTMLLPEERLERLRAVHGPAWLQACTVIVGRAVARGELVAGADPSRLLERLAAAIWLRRFVTGLPIDEFSVDLFVSDALVATQAAGEGRDRLVASTVTGAL